jgi:hypothetical protein
MIQKNHKQYLITHFHYLDKLFSNAMADLTSPSDGRLFNTHASDARPEQCQVLARYVAELRLLLRRFMEAQQLTDTIPPIKALWAFRVARSYARTAVEELRPEYLRHYGAIDADFSEAMQQLVADLLVPS